MKQKWFRTLPQRALIQCVCSDGVNRVDFILTPLKESEYCRLVQDIYLHFWEMRDAQIEAMKAAPRMLWIPKQ